MGFDGGCPGLRADLLPKDGRRRALHAAPALRTARSKFANDLRLLSAPQGDARSRLRKIRSVLLPCPISAIPCAASGSAALARYVMADAAESGLSPPATQWFERTLDDSANKRISVPEAFLAVDAILNIYLNVASGIRGLSKGHCQACASEELPFMATENIMMDAVMRGGDRQELHERIRVHSIAAGKTVKDQGLAERSDRPDRRRSAVRPEQGAAHWMQLDASTLYRPLPGAGGRFSQNLRESCAGAVWEPH